jgi:mRNA-degrading endonuclease toxin of MazEF toxin-antitoxin module
MSGWTAVALHVNAPPCLAACLHVCALWLWLWQCTHTYRVEVPVHSRDGQVSAPQVRPLPQRHQQVHLVID